MPWHVEQSGCPDGEPWAVIKDDDGSIAGCHETEADAARQVAALYASEETMTTARTFVRPSAETLEALAFDENKVRRGSDGRFDEQTGGRRPATMAPKGGGKNVGGAKPTKLTEDDAPAESPSGAPLVDFADGKATYADGSVLTKDGWAGTPKRKQGWKFAMPTSSGTVAVAEFRTTYHAPNSGRFTSPGRGRPSGGPPKMTRREPLPGERAKAAKGVNAKEKRMADQFKRPALKPPKGAKRSGSKPSPIPGRVSR
jgi:hypothetical protein